MDQEERRPDKDFKAGCIRASIWRQASEKDGRPRFSIRIGKSFRDPDGQWTSSNVYFFPQELPRLMLVASKAYAATQLNRDTGEEEGAEA
jgi:hypothetical protein